MLNITVRPPLRRVSATSRRLLVHCSTYDVAHGYGRLASDIVEALNAVPTPGGNLDLVIAPPIGDTLSTARFTMWEPTLIPSSGKAVLQSTPHVIVPCKYNFGVFRNSGYNGSIHNVPLYGDAPWSPLSVDGKLRFLCVARDNGVRYRKGVDQLIECFKLAFPTEKDVSITIKQSENCFLRRPNDDRFEMVYASISKSDYEELLAAHHCGVFLSGLEGWNFPACEIMAAGRPSIIVPFGGPTEFVTESTSWLLDYKMVSAPEEHPYYGVGMCAKPTNESVVEALRSVYRNRDLLAKKAAASTDAAARFTKEKFGERLRVVCRGIFGSV
jgi:glycosyltransferase involved in cell wall biosynthesis